MPERKSKRDEVVGNAGHPAHHRALADPHVLMDRGVAANERVITDRDVPAQHGIIGESHVIADLAVVADMAIQP